MQKCFSSLIIKYIAHSTFVNFYPFFFRQKWLSSLSHWLWLLHFSPSEFLHVFKRKILLLHVLSTAVICCAPTPWSLRRDASLTSSLAHPKLTELDYLLLQSWCSLHLVPPNSTMSPTPESSNKSMTEISKTLIVHVVYVVYLFLSLCLCSWSLLFPKHSSIVFLSKSHTSFKDLPECYFLPKTSVALLLGKLFLWIRQMPLLPWEVAAYDLPPPILTHGQSPLDWGQAAGVRDTCDSRPENTLSAQRTICFSLSFTSPPPPLPSLSFFILWARETQSTCNRCFGLHC